MTARIIWIGKNNQMVVAPRSATSAGVTAAARLVVLPQRGRAAPCLKPRDFSSLRGNLARSQERGPLFDASGMTPDAGSAAVLRHPEIIHANSLKCSSPAAGPSAAGRFWAEAVEVFTVALGLTVFGLIAGFFLVLA